MTEKRQLFRYFFLLMFIAIIFAIGWIIGKNNTNLDTLLPLTGDPEENGSTMPTIDQEANTFDGTFRSILSSIENRDYTSFQESASKELRDMFELQSNELMNTFHVETHQDLYSIFAPDMILGSISIEHCYPADVLYGIENENEVLVSYYKTGTNVRAGEVSFIKEADEWHFDGVFWKDVTNYNDTMGNIDYDHEVSFDPASGFNPQTINVELGSTLKFSNLTGKLRSYLNAPKHFVSEELIEGQYYFTPEEEGEYNYLIIYRGKKVIPFWTNDYSYFTGKIIVQ